jgi:NAD(P)-dependent dehydrogenase (short-subunit alcohol dehydrogenase family)
VSSRTDPDACHLIIGNSDGIGLALTERLLALGDQVIGISRSPLSLMSPTHAQHVIDVLDRRYSALLSTIIAELRPIDTLIYCAGIGDTFEAAGTDHDGDTIRVNLAALADTVNVVLPGMRLRGSGRIIGISSIGDAASSTAPSYGASKAGMTAYLSGLRRPLAAFGVRVSVVRFGFVDTKMAKSRVRPFMIKVDRAVDVLMDVMARGPQFGPTRSPCRR